MTWYLTDGVRKRWFCCLCGSLTETPAIRNGRYFCKVHALVAQSLDEMPPDPLQSLPMQAADTIPGEVVPHPATGTEA